MRMAISRRRFLKGATSAALLAELGLIRETAARSVIRAPSEPASITGKARWNDQYSLDPSVTYLNHGSIGTIPRVVQEAHSGYLSLCETNPWLYMWSEPWVEPREEVRRRAAALVNCDPEELAITHNTTECFNLLAGGLPLGAGDEVLFSSLNHLGASVCWYNQSVRRGYSVRQFDFPIDEIGLLNESDVVARYEEAIGPNTRILVLPHVDNTVGLRHPVAQITSMARDKGVRWIVVDGAQTASMIPVDLKALGIDVYATSAHKWIQSPKELGLAYIKEEVQTQIRPMWVTWGQNYWKDTVRIFEDYGTRALPAVIALGDALNFQTQLNEEERERHHWQLWQNMQQIVDENDNLFWRSPTSWNLSAALYAVEVRDKNGSDVAKSLFEEHGIVVRGFNTPALNGIRISPNIANDTNDLEKLVAAIGD